MLAGVHFVQVGGSASDRLDDGASLYRDRPREVAHLQSAREVVEVGDDPHHRDNREDDREAHGDPRGGRRRLTVDARQDEHAVEERADQQADDALTEAVADERAHHPW